MASPSTDLTTEDLLFQAMDRQALRFIEMLDSDEKDEHGAALYSIELKLKLFDKGQEWLNKRKKLRPTPEETEGAGIRDMREWISDPNRRQMLRDTLFDAGVVLAPDAKTGRPTKAQAVVRERFKDHKDAQKNGGAPPPDAGWQKMIGADS
jgi:hypothetical protein